MQDPAYADWCTDLWMSRTATGWHTRTLRAKQARVNHTLKKHFARHRLKLPYFSLQYDGLWVPLWLYRIVDESSPLSDPIKDHRLLAHNSTYVASLLDKTRIDVLLYKHPLEVYASVFMLGGERAFRQLIQS